MSSTVLPDDNYGPEVLSEASEKSDALTLWKVATVASAVGIIGRVALQGFPSVETVTPLAIASGYYLGWRRGLYVGATGFMASNFLIWGGQGPWTFFQAMGAGLAGIVGAGFSVFDNKYGFFTSIVSGIMAYEIIVNIGSLIYNPFGLTSPLLYLAGALPFALTHIITSVGFGGVLYGFDRKLKKFYK